MSRFLSNDEWSRRFHVFTLVGHMAYPSWCFAVWTMYLWPASLASFTIAEASYFAGLNVAAFPSYTSIGMSHARLIHSALRHTVPSGRVYSPSHCE